MPRPIPVLNDAIRPACAILSSIMGRDMASERALILLLAIGWQESHLYYRRQIAGPARSLWQFEQGGGLKGIMAHPASSGALAALCGRLDIPFESNTLFAVMTDNDLVAAACARLLLWTDPVALPAIGEVNDAWDYYRRCWRPGRPRQGTWTEAYGVAMDAVIPLPALVA